MMRQEIEGRAFKSELRLMWQIQGVAGQIETGFSRKFRNMQLI
jgi:hypothetical protein